MPFIFWIVVALIGAGIYLLRHKDQRGPVAVSTVLLMFWLGIAIGIASIFGSAFHVFDGKETAENIGFVPWNETGTYAFQFENAMADLAVGVTGFLCFWIRDRKFWLAVILVATILFWGDAVGHIYQLKEHDNHAPDNSGIVLWLDLLNPAILIALYLKAFRSSPEGNGNPPANINR
jgi:DMSO reductase anchor subunit